MLGRKGTEQTPTRATRKKWKWTNLLPGRDENTIASSPSTAPQTRWLSRKPRKNGRSGHLASILQQRTIATPHFEDINYLGGLNGEQVAVEETRPSRTPSSEGDAANGAAIPQLSLEPNTGFESDQNNAPSPSTASRQPSSSTIPDARSIPSAVSPVTPSGPSSALEDVLRPGDLIGEDLYLQGELVHLVSSNVHNKPLSKEFEVKERLRNTGSYAVVFLVQEVFRQAPTAGDDPYNSGSLTFHGRVDTHWATYGRHFAIELCSKLALAQDELEAQLSAAEIHQSLHPHPNIVTLYRTLETPSFLILVLEYVPGKDLFYLLEEYRETSSPAFSLLSSTHFSHLLSQARLHLIASMFSQMCDAVAACHTQNVSHRDIKPENFIVNDSVIIGPDGREEIHVGVKLVEFGISTTDLESTDMDCGSMPYMSFECRNNTAPTYSPPAADVWSLGITLINMVYHFNPWTDTAEGACPSFELYRRDPSNFFFHRFPGMTRPITDFLSTKVFCILDNSKPVHGQRVSAREFGEWAKSLPGLLRGHGINRGEHTTPTPSLQPRFVTNNLGHVSLAILGDNYDSIVEWLNGSNFAKSLKTAWDQHMTGTGTWFLECQAFKRFVDEDQVVLWGTGPAGVGKTFLCAASVMRLRSIFRGRPDAVVAYAFLRFDEKPSARAVLAGLLSQVLQFHAHSDAGDPRCVDATSRALRTVISHRHRGEKFSERELVAVLRDVLRGFERVFVAVDGLDEVGEEVREALLVGLMSLGRVNVLVTSRPVDHLLVHHAPHALRVSIRAHTEDIALYIAERVRQSGKLQAILRTCEDGQGLVRRLCERIQESSDGMFLVAHLQVESVIHNASSAATLFRGLEDLPAGVTAAYQSTLQRIEGESKGSPNASLAKRCFIWLLYARAKVTTRIVECALAVSLEGLAYAYGDVVPVSLVVAACCGLVEVRERVDDGVGSGVLEEVGFIHATTQEFMRGVSFPDYPNPHETLCITCIVYIRAHPEAVEAVRALRGRPAATAMRMEEALLASGHWSEMLVYALGSWSFHAREAVKAQGGSRLHPYIEEFVLGCVEFPVEYGGEGTGGEGGLRFLSGRELARFVLPSEVLGSLVLP